MNIRFTPAALDELDDILIHIAAHSPRGARRVQLRIKAVAQLLGRYPESGQRTSVPLLRRLVATPYPYLIFYQIIDNEVVIVGVRHSARNRVADR